MEWKERNNSFLTPVPAVSSGRFSPAVIALLSQVLALPLTVLLVALCGMAGFLFSLTFVAFLQGATAAIIGFSLKLPPWWVPIHLFFAPLLLLTMNLGIAPAWFLIVFLVLVLAYWTVFKTRVPFYLSSSDAAQMVLELLPKQPGFRMLDIGAGFGGMLAYLGSRRPDGHFAGIEIAPLPFCLGWLRKRLAGRAYDFDWGDFWAIDFAKYDVVYAYLSPVPMAKLWHKIQAEMRPDALLISNTFPVPGITPAMVKELDDFHHSHLYIYRVVAQPIDGSLL